MRGGKARRLLRAAHQQQAAHPRSGHALPRAVEGGADLPHDQGVLETRPVYHASDAAIRGHLFTSFLATALRKELQDRLQAAELDAEWHDGHRRPRPRRRDRRRSAGTSLHAAQPTSAGLCWFSCCQAVGCRLCRPCSDARRSRYAPGTTGRPSPRPAASAQASDGRVSRQCHQPPQRKTESTNPINTFRKTHGVEVARRIILPDYTAWQKRMNAPSEAIVRVIRLITHDVRAHKPRNRCRPG